MSELPPEHQAYAPPPPNSDQDAAQSENVQASRPEAESRIAQRPANSGVEQSETGVFTQRVRDRATAFPLALGLIAAGGLLVAESYLDDFPLDRIWAGGALLAGLILTYLLRFFVSGRRERGLFFLALLSLATLAIFGLAILSPETLDIQKIWPLSLIAGSGALFITYALERSHERGLLEVALLLMIAGLSALAVTFDLLPSDLRQPINDYWPLLLALLGVALIPLALRRSAG